MIKNSKIKKFNLNNNPKFARVSYYKYVEKCNKNFTKLIFMKKAIVFLGVFSLGQNAFAQEEKRESKLKITGYTEIFYSYDFNQREDHIKQPFFYTFNRHNEVNVNIARIKANYETENMRANFALMAGTYPQDNMVLESEMTKYIQEANIGFKISKNKNVWVDAGVLPSYIELEGEISKDDMTLTRTVAVANSPFFMTGAQVTYTTDNNKWVLSGGVYNGWQKIRRAVFDKDGSVTASSATKLPSFGTKVTYQPNEKWFFNSSTYIGKDPITEEKMRYFHDFYAIFKASDKLEFNFIFDIGADQREKKSRQYNVYWSPNLMAKYYFTPKFSTAGRIEYYHDAKNAMGWVGEGQRYQILGASINFDYLIYKNLMWRLEFRNLNSKDPIFTKINESHPKVDNNFFITTTLNAWF